MSKTIFEIRRIYVKNTSFKAIDTPEVFLEKGVSDNHLELRVNHRKLTEPNHYEVVLGLDIKSKVGKQAVYELKVEQAGIFKLKNFPEDKIEELIEIACADRLYPYASNIVTQLTTNGTFMPAVLQPIDFEQLYREKLRAQKERKK